MAASVLRTPTNSSSTLTTTTSAFKSHINYANKSLGVSFAHRRTYTHSLTSRTCRLLHSTTKLPISFRKFSPVASSGEAASAAETTVQADAEDGLQAQQPQHQLEENSDGGVGAEENTSEIDVAADAEEPPPSIIKASLQSYREALANNDEAKVAEIEGFLKSIEDEKLNLELRLAAISEQLSYEKERVLRISADFDNFRKRTERERLSLVTNAQGEVVETLLPVLDNFERAKSQIKVETEEEQKISNSYQSIYKQFLEILGSLGVTPVETVGKPFDPLLHEAIMREDSTEYEEGVVIEEYRKGFQLGDRLLRPSMVKVSAGPGPAKSESMEPIEGQDDAIETSAGSAESKSAED